MSQVEIVPLGDEHTVVALASGRSWRAEVFVFEPRGRHAVAATHGDHDARESREPGDWSLVLLPSAAGVVVIDARGRRHALRPGEPFDAARVDAREIEVGGARALVLAVGYSPREFGVSASVCRFERRGGGRLLETVAAGGHAVVVAAHGALRVRLAGEDEPVDLEHDEALVVGAQRDTEFDVAAPEGGATALVALFTPT